MPNRAMKVLHLPYNIASQISVTVQGLREIGIDASGMVFDNNVIQDPSGLLMLPEIMSRRRNPIRGSLNLWSLRRTVLHAIQLADVVHWHFSWALPKAFDVEYAARLGKTGIVEFWGSDIRIPRVASAENPYLTRMYRDHPQLDQGAEERSRESQQTFSRHGMTCLIPGPALLSHVDRSLFPSFYRTRQRVLIREYEVAYPDPGGKRPLVLHMPSNKIWKGTDAVIRAVEQLRPSYDFEFRLVHGVKRSEALQILRSCDVFLDQFVGGGHGLAALESMAFGKPTVCYIMPSLVPLYPPDLPIVVATQDNLSHVLSGLLRNAQRRHEIGRLSRTYVEKYHDARLLAGELVKIYEELLSKSRRNRSS